MPETKFKGLHGKLLEIRKTMQYFQKTATGYNYNYVGGCDVIGTFRETADKLGVLLYPSITGKTITETKVMNDKNQEKIGRIITLDITYTFVDAETGETLPIPFVAFGEQQDSSKAFGSALTYAERYFLLKFFVVPTDKDDPDKKGFGLKDDEHTITYQESKTPPEKKTEDPTRSIKKGDELSTSHFISDEERDLWNKKKAIPESRHRAIDYMLEKINLGERLEKAIYMKIMATEKDINKKEAEAKARERIIKEFAPLEKNEISIKFKEYLQ